MAKLSDHQSSETTKLLFIGSSGSGKTGALASLAKAGYNLRILDFDNGLDILPNLLADAPDALARVDYVTLQDEYKMMGNVLKPSRATAWSETAKTLNNWPGLGPITEWTPQDVLVIDSMTFAGRAAMNFVLALGNRLGGLPQQQDYFMAQGLVENLLATLYSNAVRCNVIVCTHVKFISDDDTKTTSGFAETSVGKGLSSKVGRYFNAILMAKSTQMGPRTTRTIHTISQGNIELKNPAPGKVPPSYPLETGLADYFNAVRKGK